MKNTVSHLVSKYLKIILNLKLSKPYKQKANLYKAAIMCLLTFVGIRVLILGVACAKEAVANNTTPLVYSKVIMAAVSLDKEVMNLVSNERTATFKITADADWQLISSGLSWCTPDQLTGVAGTSLITVNLTGDNTDINPKTCVLTVLAQNLNPQPKITITQLGSLPTILLESTSVNLPSTQFRETIEVVSNIEWSVSSSASSWCSVSKRGNLASVQVNANTSTLPRTCILTLSGNGVNPNPTYTITQSGSLPTILLENLSSSFSSSEGGTSVNVVSNTDWTVGVSNNNNTWCAIDRTSGSGNGVVNIRVAANNTISARNCILTFASSGVNPSPTYTITQSAGDASLSLGSTESTIASTAGSVTVSVSSNTTWTVVSSAAWCTLSSASGSNNGSVTINAIANSTISARNCIVTFSASGVSSSTYTLTQNAGGANLSINNTEETLASSAGSVMVNVSSNTSWSVTSSISWCTLSSSTGSNNGSVTVRVVANPTISARNCVVTFSANGVSSSTYTLTQNASAANLSIDSTESTIASTAGSAIVNVSSNTSWSVSSSVSWCTLSSSTGTNNGSVTISAAANSTISARSCIVTFSASGVNPSPTYTLTQNAGGPTLSINSTSSTIASTAGSVIVNVSSNTSWSVTSSAVWCTLSGASGSNNGSVTISAVANPTISTRSCIITFSASGVNPSPTYTLTQNAGGPTLSIDSTESSIASTAGSVIVNVSSNTSWSVTSSISWCTLSSASGSNNGSVTINAVANPTISARNCIITFSASNVSPSPTYTLTQNASAPNLSIDSTSSTLASTAGSSVVNVSSNTSWSVSSSESWCSLSNSSGSDNGSVTISAVANTTTFTRSCIITFSASDVNPNLTYVLTQGAAAAFLTISKTTDNIVSTGGSVSAITVSSNTNWTASISSAAWCSLSSSSGSNNGSVIVSAIANPTISSRTCVVTFTASSGTSTYNLVQAAGGATLSIDRTSVTLTKAAGSYIVNVSSNTSWTVSANSPLWCSLSSASGSNNGSVTINATANSTAYRNCVVTFSASGVNTSPTFTLTQLGSYLLLSLSQNGFIIESTATSSNVTITVEADWTATSNSSSWCTLSSSSGEAGSSVLTINSTANATSSARQCLVTITPDGDTNKNQIVTIFQKSTTLTIVDFDGDGLIEIDSITKLANIRFNENGTSYKTSAAATGLTGGCPASGCKGYELVGDLDFNGSIYANSGGTLWETLALTNTIFNGNGFAIRNYYLNDPTAIKYRSGLFSIVTSSVISNLALINFDVRVPYGYIYGGALISFLNGTVGAKNTIQNIYLKGLVDGTNSTASIGTLVGIANVSNITNVAANVTVIASKGVTNALVGSLGYGSSLSNSYAIGSISEVSDAPPSRINGLVFFEASETTFSNNISGLTITVNQALIDANKVAALLGLSSKIYATPPTVTISGINYYTDAKGTNGYIFGTDAGTTSCPATVCIKKTVAEIQALKSTDAPYSSWGTTNWDLTNKTAEGYPALKTTTGVRIAGQ